MVYMVAPFFLISRYELHNTNQTAILTTKVTKGHEERQRKRWAVRNGAARSLVPTC